MGFFNLPNYLFFLFVIWNVIVFLIYGLDKLKAKKNLWRTTEAALLLCAAFLGGGGALCGMLIFRHKTQKLKFRILVPLFAVLSFAEICAAGLLAQKYL